MTNVYLLELICCYFLYYVGHSNSDVHALISLLKKQTDECLLRKLQVVA